jgi:hypothetical protein
LETLYFLKSHPFGEVYEAPLDPRTDSAHIFYYVDVYDWTRSQFLCRISPENSFEVFPHLDARAAMLVLIAGPNQTGRESLRNLILHKIEEETRDKHCCPN